MIHLPLTHRCRNPITAPRRRLGLLAVLAGGALTFLGAPLRAEPVTLRFEAEVETINRGPTPLALPFDVEVGNVIRGAFTFEPLDVDSSVQRTETLQPFEAAFEIDSFSFSSADYVAQSFDDIMSDEDNGGGLLQPPAPDDEIRLTRNLGGDLGDPHMLQWGFAFAFFGDENTLKGADLPADLSSWRSFSEASLRLTIADEALASSTVIRTSLLRVAIPEPKSVVILVLCVAIFAACRFSTR